MHRFELPTDEARHSTALHFLWAAEMDIIQAAQAPACVLTTSEIADRVRKCREALLLIERNLTNKGEAK